MAVAIWRGVAPAVALVNTVMSAILAIVITAIAAITAVIKPIKPIKQPFFLSDSFPIRLPVAYHNSRCLVKGARRKSAKGRGQSPAPPRGEMEKGSTVQVTLLGDVGKREKGGLRLD